MDSFINLKTLVALGVFLGWTATSFLCHELGKTFLALSEENISSMGYECGPMSRFLFSIILTAVQCATCYLSVALKSANGSPLLYLLMTSHALATLATNYSMAYIEAACTLAIKLMEPVTMAIAHYIFFNTAISIQTLISIPIIVCGALLFSVKSITDTAENMGIILAFTSNIILAARNVSIKKLQGSTVSSSSPVFLRSNWRICVTVLCTIAVVVATYMLERSSVVPARTAVAIVVLVGSGLFHVSYSYISTNLVLKVMNIVSHSIANIFKRLLVVLLLYIVGRHHASKWNFTGLIMASLGLCIYVQGKMAATPTGVSESNGGEKYSIWASKTLQRTFGLVLGFVAILSVTRAAQQENLFQQLRYFSTKVTYDPFLHRQLQFLHSFASDRVVGTRYTFDSDSLTDTPDPYIKEFLSWHLLEHPEETDRRAKTLSSNMEIIAESQRVLFNLLSDLIGRAKHVMLMEIATYENKGDPAITAGEVLMLRQMNKTIVYYCETSTCGKEEHMKQGIEISKRYAKDDLVVLMQGGGNLVGYSGHDDIRDIIMKAYPERRLILLSQSIWLGPNSNGALKRAQNIYSNNSNLFMFLRDRQSLAIAKEHFKGIKHILAPDMAFGIGIVPRQMAPFYDIIWLRRGDYESSRYSLPDFPEGLSVHVSDWISNWRSNRGSRDLETSFLIAQAGFQFLQRGRVVVTDRLHGHILSTLMSIPHVIIDNPPYFKLSSFDNSWTANLSNVFRVSNGTLALNAAMKLLERYNDMLPPVGPKDMNRFELP